MIIARMAKRETVNFLRDKFPTKPLQRRDGDGGKFSASFIEYKLHCILWIFYEASSGVRQQTARRGNDFARWWTAEINRSIFVTDRVAMRLFFTRRKKMYLSYLKLKKRPYLCLANLRREFSWYIILIEILFRIFIRRCLCEIWVEVFGFSAAISLSVRHRAIR